MPHTLDTPSAEAAESSVSRARAWAVAAVATLAMSVSYLDRQALAVLAPTVRDALAISGKEYGWLLAAFSLAYLVGSPFAGAVVDRVGARRGFVSALLAWSCVAALHALVPGYALLFTARIALGLTESPSFPAATQTVRRILPAESRSAGFGLLFTGSSIGAMIAAPLAIALHEAYGSWRLAFVGTSLVGLAWLPLWLFVTRPRAVREALARPEPEPDARAAPPPSRWALLRMPAVLRAMFLVVATAPSIMFALNWSSLYLADTFHLPQDALAKYLWVPPVFFDAGAVVFGALASRRDRRTPGEVRTHAPLVLTASLLSGAMCVIPFVHAPWHATVFASISLAGGGACFALLTADMIARVTPSHASTAGGLTAAAQSLAYVVAGLVVGAVVDRAHSYAGILWVLGAVVPVAGVAWSVWPVRDATPHGARDRARVP